MKKNFAHEQLLGDYLTAQEMKPKLPYIWTDKKEVKGLLEQGPNFHGLMKLQIIGILTVLLITFSYQPYVPKGRETSNHEINVKKNQRIAFPFSWSAKAYIVYMQNVQSRNWTIENHNTEFQTEF